MYAISVKNKVITLTWKGPGIQSGTSFLSCASRAAAAAEKLLMAKPSS